MKNSYFEPHQLNGTVELSQKVMVSDPCYAVDTWCQGTVDNMIPGKYHCFYELYHDETMDSVKYAKISSFTLVHEDYLSEYNESTIFTHTEIDVGVDSGQAGVFNYDYYVENQPDGDYYDLNSWYRRISELTMGTTNGLAIGFMDNQCCASSSGYGDGSYDCYIAENDNHEAFAIKVVFIKNRKEKN